VSLLDILPSLRWRDLVDILFLSVVVYQLFVWFRGTRALRVLIGLVVLGLVYALAKFWGLFMTTWAFQILWQVLIILVLILFQDEIRQVLERVSPLRYLPSRRQASASAAIEELARTAFELACEGVGALVVLVREDSIQEYIIAGHSVMALPSGPLLKSIFNPHGPAHDGAVIMADGRVTEMGAVLPLSIRADVPERYGTRHRAALGLAERTDAICLVVSEERGEVSTVVGGEIVAWESAEALGAKLRECLGLTEVARPTVAGVLKGFFLDHWWVKIGVVAVMTLAWLILAGQQNYDVEVAAPVRYVRLAPDLILSKVTPAQVNLVVTGRRHLAVNLKPGEVRVRVDLADYGAGEQVIRLSAGNVILPVGLAVERIRPPDVRVVLKPR
jgi:uncharacterized protein (TIGR00159 family)